MASTWKIRTNHLCSSVFICGFLLLASAAHAEVTVKDAWVRGTVPAQKSTGAFATLTSTEDAKLVGA
jgi:copper(I)-binding protein